MLKFIKKLFQSGHKTNFAELVKQGAIILDVRTRGEYNSGHIKGSINIALNELPSQLNKLKNKQTPIITCCASGARSASAKILLESLGYTMVYNGGGWQNLNQKIN
jgi:phage shock protein E